MRRAATAALVATCFAICLACTAPAPQSLKEGTKGSVAAEPASAGGAAERAAARAKRRAQAEADAELKNQENRKAWQADVARLTADHPKRVEKFKVDKAAYYDTAIPAYEKAMAEYKASKKLHNISLDLAAAALDGRARTKQALKELSLRKYREFIKLNSDTQAAKDAAEDVETISRGGYVKVRDLPPEPIRPEFPVEPVLTLPPEPQPVAVNYPPDPDDIAAGPAAPSTGETGSSTTPYIGGGSGGAGASNSKPVHVSGYTRKNGTYVAPHDRAAPGQGSKGKRR